MKKYIFIISETIILLFIIVISVAIYNIKIHTPNDDNFAFDVTDMTIETESIKEAVTETTVSDTEIIKKADNSNSESINYFELYNENPEDARNHDEAFKKTWISNDSRIQFTLDTKYGPFGDERTYGTYLVDNEKYTVEVLIGNKRCDIVYSDANDSDVFRNILSGEISYNSNNNSFTVKNEGYAYYYNKEAHAVVTVPSDEYGDENIPVYKGGEEITFKMI